MLQVQVFIVYTRRSARAGIGAFVDCPAIQCCVHESHVLPGIPAH